jgi:hypothetical protein
VGTWAEWMHVLARGAFIGAFMFVGLRWLRSRSRPGYINLRFVIPVAIFTGISGGLEATFGVRLLQWPLCVLSIILVLSLISFRLFRGRSDGKRKGRYLNREEIVEGIRKQFSSEYAEFLLVQMGLSPQVCPTCGNGSFTTLWLAKPNDAIDGQMWAKWYFWCDQCFSGIRCPLGTWRIPRTTPYILHGDETALAAALPENLKLVPQK